MSLEIENLTFGYENFPVLKELSLKLEAGEIGVLLGASGSGKSTLLKLIAGLLPLQKGVLKKSGAPAYMTQENLLLPWRTALSNLLLLTELGPKHPPDSAEIEALLKEMELSGCENLYPAHLSVGMRQRLALAQTLLMKRPLLLLDEPFNSLDLILREKMYELLKEMHRKHKMTLLMVTHDYRDALALADRIFLLKEGKIEKEWKNCSLPEETILFELRSSLCGEPTSPITGHRRHRESSRDPSA